MELYSLSLIEIANKIKNKEVTIKEVLDSVYERIEKVENKVDAYVTITKEEAYKKAEKLQEKLDNGEDIGILGGVPIAIKDNICTKDVRTTCSSKMLENFVPFYDATVAKKLEEKAANLLYFITICRFFIAS